MSFTRGVLLFCDGNELDFVFVIPKSARKSCTLYRRLITNRRIEHGMRNAIEVCVEFEDEPVREGVWLCSRNDIIVCHMNSLLSPEK